MHSGTTLLRNILSLPPEVYGIETETRVFEKLPLLVRGSLSGKTSWPQGVVDEMIAMFEAGKDTGAVDQLSQACASFLPFLTSSPPEHREEAEAQILSLFRGMCDHLTRVNSCERWVEKTPTHVFHLSLVFRHFPDARVVEVVRDPRDIAASKKTRTLTVGLDRYDIDEIPFKRLEKDFDPVLDTLSWKSALVAGKLGTERYGDDRVRRVRYEDLVLDPAGTLPEVCSFLDLRFTESMLSPSGRIAADTEAPRVGIHADSVGRWRSILTPAEAVVVTWLAQPAIAELGLPAAAATLGACQRL